MASPFADYQSFNGIQYMSLTSFIDTARTEIELSLKDWSIINYLAEYNTQWVFVSDSFLSEISVDSLDELLSWLRCQSVNKIESICGKKLAGFTVIKTWMYDPEKNKVFFTVSPYLIN